MASASEAGYGNVNFATMEEPTTPPVKLAANKPR
jgi:hypothetical protein